MAFDKDAWIKLAISHGHYWAKEDGSIYRRSATGGFVGRLIVPSTHKKTGRVYFTMTFLGISKSVLVNRFIGLALIPNPHNLPEVNHKDGVKAHNWVGNLEWSSRSDQEKHAFKKGLKTTQGSSNPNAKLSAADVIYIRETNHLPEFYAKHFGVSVSTIRSIRSGKSWKALAA